MEIKKREELSQEAKKFFEAYKKKIVGESLKEKGTIVYLDFLDLQEYSPTLSDSVLELPIETIALLEDALSQLEIQKNPRIRFSNLPDSETIHLKIRNIRAKNLDQMIWIEGIVRQASDVRPQVVNARFECPTCGAILSVLQIDKKFHEPSRCSCGRKGQFKILSKEMVDAQRLVIEESPDSLEGGEQPKRLSIFLQEDLVEPRLEERTTPGSRVRIFGVLKEVPIPLQTGAISTRFDIAIEANNIIPLEETFADLKISEEEEKQILEISSDPTAYKRLSQSIAPSVYGFDKIKEALLLQLFSGIKKKKSDGGFTRGNIHILLVGDPGVAKSVTLKFISRIAPKGRYVSGKATTGAGLCVSPNSLLLTNPGGIEKIEKVVEDRLTNKEEIKDGVWRQKNINDIKIQSLSNELKIQSKYPEAIWKLESPEYIRQIILSSGKKIEITENTQLLTINNGELKWKKSSEINERDFIATPRKLIPGDIEKQYLVDLIKSNPVIHNIKPLVKEMSSKLAAKYGNLREAARRLGIKENNLYHNWVKERARGNIKLKTLKKIAEETNCEWKDKIKVVSLYNGKNHSLPVYINEDLLYLAGLIAGDGDIRKSGETYSIRLSNENEELHNLFQKVVKEQFNLSFDIQEGNERRPQSTRTHSTLLREILSSLGIPDSPKSNKIIMSKPLLHLSNNLLSNYIAGLYDTDGSVCIRRTKGSNLIDFTTCSETLARQMQLALLRFNIRANLRIRQPSQGKIKGNYDKYILEIRGMEQIKGFARNIPLRHPLKKQKLNELIQKDINSNTNIDVIPTLAERIKNFLIKNKISLTKSKWRKNLSREAILQLTSRYSINNKEWEEIKKVASADIFWERVRSNAKKKADYKYVYDLTVEESHNFVVDGVLVHNTAAVIKDEFLKGWSLEAGAMVLANKGTICVDEIEKMDEHDRSTMHEAMEQQSISISKANIHATLRSETSVLAAGNPKLGRFDPLTPIPQQIDISPALLSRFDVIFILRDIPNKTQDEAIASHVLEEHQQEVIREVVSPELLRKYIAHAQKFNPKLTDEAAREIKDFYIKLRNQSIATDKDIKPIPITARQLEAIVRLSEACARVRLSTTVTASDAQRAIDLLKYSLMQVGYDEETKTFDIDRITTGISSSKRSKIVSVRETIASLEPKLGKLIPITEIQNTLQGKLSDLEIDDAIHELLKSGDFIFQPKQGYVQRM